MRVQTMRLIPLLLYSLQVSCPLGFQYLTTTLRNDSTKDRRKERFQAVVDRNSERDREDSFKSVGRRNVLNAVACILLTTATTTTSKIAHALDSHTKVAIELTTSNNNYNSNNSKSTQKNKPNKILVLGGTGFVGSHIVQRLKQAGIDHVATSRDGRDGTVALDIVASSSDSKTVKETIKALAQDCTAIISCIGTIGTDQDGPVNAAAGNVALVIQEMRREQQQKQQEDSAVERFVYITVAPEVQELVADMDYFREYIQGKSFSRETVLNVFQDRAVLIEPTFIYQGGSFEKWKLPSVTTGAADSLVKGTMLPASSSPTTRTIQRLLSSPRPGMLKMVLEPPVPVEDVAAAAIAGALGYSHNEQKNAQKPTILDTYDKIKQAAVAAAVKG